MFPRLSGDSTNGWSAASRQAAMTNWLERSQDLSWINRKGALNWNRGCEYRYGEEHCRCHNQDDRISWTYAVQEAFEQARRRKPDDRADAMPAHTKTADLPKIMARIAAGVAPRAIRTPIS